MPENNIGIIDVQKLLEEKAHNAENAVGLVNALSGASVTVNDEGIIELITKDGMSLRVHHPTGTTYLTSPKTKVQSNQLSFGVPGGVFLTMDDDTFAVESENSKIVMSGNQAKMDVNGAKFDYADDGSIKVSTKDEMGISFEPSKNSVEIIGPNGSSIVMRHNEQKGNVIDFNCDVLSSKGEGNIGSDILDEFTIADSESGDILLDISKLSDKTVGLDHELQLADKSVTADKIADGVIMGDKLGPGSIDALHLKDGCIGEIKLKPGAITESKLNFQTHLLY